VALSDFDAVRFFPAIKAFVSAQGVEPISDGEIESEIWGKVKEAAAKAGSPISDGLSPPELVRLAYGLAVNGPAAPAGYSRSTINGEPLTYLGQPVFDNGSKLITLGA